MKKFLTLLLLISNIMIANESKRDGFSIPTLIGEGLLKVLWWEVYYVRLLTDETFFSWKKKFMLEFEYKREVKKNDTIESSLKELQRQVNITEKDIDDWHVYLEQAIQSVQQETKRLWNGILKEKLLFIMKVMHPSLLIMKILQKLFLTFG